MRFLVLLIILGMAFEIPATTPCSRYALIDNQEILVDINSNQKGEGLRYYLEQDDGAKSYLKKYQRGTQVKRKNVVLGTLGTSMVLGGLIFNNSRNNGRKWALGGIILLMINFTLHKILADNNEVYLKKAIEEYNKKNSPIIYFQSQNNQINYNPNILISKKWKF